MSKKVIVDDENQSIPLSVGWKKHNVKPEMFQQSFVDFMDTKARLSFALEILGVSEKAPKHHRHVLISAIMMFAGVNKDDELERQCDEELKAIRAE